MRVTIVRHGETDHNREGRCQGHVDIPLNNMGEDQAQVAAAKLRAWDRGQFDAAFSSDLSRAKRTAELLLPSEFPLQTLPELRERYMGRIQGLLYQDARALAASENKTLQDFGETPDELKARLLKGWDAVIEKSKSNGYRDILIVSHGGALIALIKGLVESGRVDPGTCGPEIGASHRNCAITTIENGTLKEYATQVVESVASKKDLQ